MRKRRAVYLTLLLTLLLFSTLFMIGLTATGAFNDETPPEAVITFDPQTLSIVVVGVDDFDPDVEVTSLVLGEKHDETTIKYTLTDDAGNYMEITLELKEKKHHAEVKVLELSYNGEEPIFPEKNHYKVHWNHKYPLKHLHQKIDVHHQFKVKTHYKAKRNETKIDIEVKCHHKEKIVLPGLVIVSLVTDRGSLNYRIEFVDSFLPEIVGVWRFPETPNYDESVTVVAHVIDNDNFEDDFDHNNHDDHDDHDFDDYCDDFDDDYDDHHKQSGVKSVILSYSADSISWVNVTMNLVDELYIAEIPPLPYNTTVSYKIYAYDWAGNLAISETYSYVVADSYPPLISYVDHTPASPNYSETVSVSANVTEPLNASGVKDVILNYWNGSAWTHDDMTLQDMLYTATIPALPSETTVQYRVSASDWAGNWAASDTYSYTVGAPLNLPPVAKFTESAEIVYTGETISFNASDSYDPDGDIVSYFWDFGDGIHITVTSAFVDHVYVDDGVYTVTLTVTDDGGLTATATSTKTVSNRPPVASFAESATTVLTDEIIHFDASESYDPDGDIIIYAWDFGDGNEATGVTVDHAYDDNGDYTVTLTVIDDDGTTASTSAAKTVSNRPPVVFFTENATTVKEGEVIHFDASDSYDPDGDIVSYFWDFGDGTNTTGVTVDHAYAEEGNYTVTLTVTDDDGASSSMSSTKTVEAVTAAGWPLALLAAIGLGIAALTATLLYGLYRRRKKRRTASNPGSHPIVTLYIPAKILAGCN